MGNLYRTQILLERRQHQDLSSWPKAEGRSMSEIVREAVAEYLVEREGRRRLDWKERLVELAKFGRRFARNLENFREFILNDRAEREGRACSKVWGVSDHRRGFQPGGSPGITLTYDALAVKRLVYGAGRVNGLSRPYFSNTN